MILSILDRFYSIEIEDKEIEFEIRDNALTSIFYLTRNNEGENSFINDTLKLKNINKIFEYSVCDNFFISLKSIRIIANCTSGSDDDIEKLINLGAIESIYHCLNKV